MKCDIKTCNWAGSDAYSPINGWSSEICLGNSNDDKLLKRCLWFYDNVWQLVSEPRQNCTNDLKIWAEEHNFYRKKITLFWSSDTQVSNENNVFTSCMPPTAIPHVLIRSLLQFTDHLALNTQRITWFHPEFKSLSIASEI